MTGANKALIIMVVVSLGLWGCAQEQNHGTTTARIKALEAKHAKLEDDYRALLASRDQLRSRLNAAEEQKTTLEQQVEQVPVLTKERDQLRQEVTVRVGERDVLQSQVEQIRKGIRNLLGQVEAVSTAPAGQPITSAARIGTPEQS